MNAVNGDLQYALSNLYLLGLLEKVKSYGNQWGTVFGILIFIDLHIELVNPGREVVCGKRRTQCKWWCGKYRFDLLCPVYIEELEVNYSCLHEIYRTLLQAAEACGSFDSKKS